MEFQDFYVTYELLDKEIKRLDQNNLGHREFVLALMEHLVDTFILPVNHLPRHPLCDVYFDQDIYIYKIREGLKLKCADPGVTASILDYISSPRPWDNLGFTAAELQECIAEAELYPYSDEALACLVGAVKGNEVRLNLLSLKNFLGLTHLLPIYPATEPEIKATPELIKALPQEQLEYQRLEKRYRKLGLDSGIIAAPELLNDFFPRAYSRLCELYGVKPESSKS